MEKRKTCSCGSREFVRLKFGGRQFQLNLEDSVALFKWSGFEPDMSACKACGEIRWSLPDEVLGKLQEH